MTQPVFEGHSRFTTSSPSSEGEIRYLVERLQPRTDLRSTLQPTSSRVELHASPMTLTVWSHSKLGLQPFGPRQERTAINLESTQRRVFPSVVHADSSSRVLAKQLSPMFAMLVSHKAWSAAVWQPVGPRHGKGDRRR